MFLSPNSIHSNVCTQPAYAFMQSKIQEGDQTCNLLISIHMLTELSCKQGSVAADRYEVK